MEKQVELKRSMGLLSGLSLVIGTVIGSGVFFKQAGVLQQAGSTTMGLVAWIAGGVITLAAGLTIAEVANRLPKTGGLFSYIEDLYGPTAGFLTGWMQVVVYAPAVIASIGGYAAYLTANFLGWDISTARWITVVYVLFVMALNMLENRITSAFQVITTSIKMLPIIVLVVYGLFFGKVDALGQTVAQVSSSAHGGLGMAILATLFAYDGWILLGNIAGELKNPHRDMPRAIILGITTIVLAYVGVTYATYRTLPATEIVHLQNNTTFAMATKAFGDFGGRALSVTIIISMWGTLNGKMISFPRMAYAMAKDGLFPKYLSRLNKHTQEPINAIATVAAMTIAIAVFTDSADRLSDIAIFTIWIFYTAAFFGIFILRRRDRGRNAETLFKTPLYPITPLVAIGGAFFVLGSTFVTDFSGVLISLVLVGLGLPVYYYYRHKNHIAK
ncbi:serine/threonine exchanger SteT [Weissella viridescens]|uniref:APC family amino acid-polyamine-organocation transporter n=3 Tax=Weissella viridescens TaxID=1629 RepID=A0A0R2H624_WEIVI|nr:amino acid permease [Weissella viridescens]KRN45973.1 APC family amino acid-polyamine-organocation transporter [Weissella viridescens]GEA95110.1 serine/threonine exchanger SteT [Weissella viridescens]